MKDIGEYSLAWDLLESGVLVPRLGSIQQPIGSSAGTTQAKQLTGRNTALLVIILIKVFLKSQLPRDFPHDPGLLTRGPRPSSTRTEMKNTLEGISSRINEGDE